MLYLSVFFFFLELLISYIFQTQNINLSFKQTPNDKLIFCSNSYHHLGKTFYGIIDNSELEYIEVKKEVPTKLEDDENINEFGESNESFETPGDCKDFNKDEIRGGRLFDNIIDIKG